MRRAPWIVAVVAAVAASALPRGTRADELTTDDTLSAAEADVSETAPSRSMWNQYTGKYFTLRGGFGFLVDAVTYDQDASSEEQMMLDPDVKLRDFRLILNGKLLFAPRLSYTLGYMYDGAQDDWRFRQTGLMVDVPELQGTIFLGRTKEGFSTNKLMVGYNGWTIERSAANDAFVPILADGVKWTGWASRGLLVYNLGAFTDLLAEEQSYVKNDWLVAGRAVLLPFALGASGKVLHLAVQGRYGVADDGTLQFRSRPESFPAQEYVVDTGELPASSHTMLGVETYYSPGALVFGMEYYFNQVASKAVDDPLFHGGEAFLAYLYKGTRDYNNRGGFFEAAVPDRSAFTGGLGAVELVLRVSYVDLDTMDVPGGRFFRVTPGLSWYLSDNLRLEAAYGYGLSDRMGLEGATHILQARTQLTLN